MSVERPVIRTRRLLLDAMRIEDAAEFLAYRGDPEVARYQGWRPANEAEATAFIVRNGTSDFGVAGRWYQWAVRGKDHARLLGDVGLHFPSTEEGPIEFGVSMKPAAQRRGYAHEAVTALIDLAFGPLRHRRVIASVDPRNTASMALCRALGMRQEAHHVESFRDGDAWADDVIFALLAREWPSPHRC